VIIWNEEYKTVSIEWLEDKGKKSEPWGLRKTPLRLQLHPVSKEVMRVHFKGAQPGWIKRFAEKMKYKTREVSNKQGKGWWISNWYGHQEKPLLSPFIKGMIQEWFEKVHESCQSDKDRLLKHLEIVEINLYYHADKFTQYGFHFRGEELLRDGGALYLEERLLPVETTEGEFSIDDWPTYTELIQELLEVRDIPETDEVLIRLEEVDEEDFVLVLPEMVVEEEKEKDSTADDLEVELVEEKDLIVLKEEDDVFLELEESGEDFVFVESEEASKVEGEESSDLNGFFDEVSDEIETIEDSIEETIGESVEENVDSEIIETTDVMEVVPEEREEIIPPVISTLIVSEKSIKKEGIVAGQTLLF